MLKKSENFEKVKFVPHDKEDETQGHYLFKKEVEFFVKKIKACMKSKAEFEERLESCSNNYMVE